MDDRIKESISALLDNEADELELRRVLSHSDDTEMKAVWSRYSKMSDLLARGQRSFDDQRYSDNTMAEQVDDEPTPLTDSLSQHMAIDISEQVSRSIDEIHDVDQATVASNDDSGSPSSKKKTGVISLFAVAATIAMTLSLLISPTEEGNINLEGLLASNETTVSVNERPFSPDQARILNQYLLRHAENSVSGGRPGVMPLARVASFNVADNY